MPIYSYEGITARFADQLTGFSIYSFLTNKSTFHVKTNSETNGELFSFISENFTLKLVIKKGKVVFERGMHEVCVKLGRVQYSIEILLSWSPDFIFLVVDVDGKRENGGYSHIKTDPIYVPNYLVSWARKYSLIRKTFYKNSAEFLGVLKNSLDHANKSIKETGCQKLFWDLSRKKDNAKNNTPKLEPDVTASIEAFLQDQSIISGYELFRESSAKSGSIDLCAVAQLENREFSKICIELKNCHANRDVLLHGIRNQLPAYMQSKQAEYGIYLLLWYKSSSFSFPKCGQLELISGLKKAVPSNDIIVSLFDLSLPVPPSSKEFEID